MGDTRLYAHLGKHLSNCQARTRMGQTTILQTVLQHQRNHVLRIMADIHTLHAETTFQYGNNLLRVCSLIRLLWNG